MSPKACTASNLRSGVHCHSRTRHKGFRSSASNNCSVFIPFIANFFIFRDEQTSADVYDVSSFGLPQDCGPGGAGGACTNSMVLSLSEFFAFHAFWLVHSLWLSAVYRLFSSFILHFPSLFCGRPWSIIYFRCFCVSPCLSLYLLTCLCAHMCMCACVDPSVHPSVYLS